MVEVTVLGASDVVMMLLWQDLLVLDRLHGVVVVVLVDLFVNSCVHLLMLMRLDCLMLHGGVDIFVDSRLVVSGLGHEAGDGFLGLIHFDGCRVGMCV